MGLFSRKKKIEKIEKEELDILESQDANENDDEITAVIAATIAVMNEEEVVACITAAIAIILGTNTSEFVVRNIKRTPELDSIWAQVGRMQLMR